MLEKVWKKGTGAIQRQPVEQRLACHAEVFRDKLRGLAALHASTPRLRSSVSFSALRHRASDLCAGFMGRESSRTPEKVNTILRLLVTSG